MDQRNANGKEDAFQQKRKEENPTKFMNFGEEDNFADISNPKPLVDIMVTFNKDSNKARRMAAQYGREMMSQTKEDQENFNKKIQKTFDRRIKRIRRKRNKHNPGKKINFNDPLIETLPNGKIPDLPPMLDDFKPKKEEFYEDYNANSYKSCERPVSRPISKAEVGQKFGIRVDIPRSRTPTPYEMRNDQSFNFSKNMVNPQREVPNMRGSFSPQPPYYRGQPMYPPPYMPDQQSMMYQQHMMRNAPMHANRGYATPPPQYTSQYPMFNGMYANKPGPYGIPMAPQMQTYYSSNQRMMQGGMPMRPPRPQMPPSNMQNAYGISITPRERTKVSIKPRDEFYSDTSYAMDSQEYSEYSMQSESIYSDMPYLSESSEFMSSEAGPNYDSFESSEGCYMSGTEQATDGKRFESSSSDYDYYYD